MISNMKGIRALHSSRSTRIRLQEKFRVIDVKPTDSLNAFAQKEWLRQQAAPIMAQSGIPESDDLDPAGAEYDGFKKIQVRIYIFFLSFASDSPLNSVSWCQSYNSMSARSKWFKSEQYHCPIDTSAVAKSHCL